MQYVLDDAENRPALILFSNYNLCVSVSLCLYLQQIPGQARDEDGGDRHTLRAEPVPEWAEPVPGCMNRLFLN